MAAEGSFVELLCSPPSYGGDRRAPGLHVSLCGCLQGETGELSPSFLAATLFSGLRVIGGASAQEPCVQASGNVAGFWLSLQGQARCVEGGCGERDLRCFRISWTSWLLSPLRSFRDEKATGYPEQSSGSQAYRMHLGNQAIGCPEEFRRRPGSRMPRRVPGAGGIALVKMPRTSLDVRTPSMPERS